MDSGLMQEWWEGLLTLSKAYLLHKDLNHLSEVINPEYSKIKVNGLASICGEVIAFK